jgi:VIT family
LTLHIEKHFLSSALVRDIVIGMADGLTVPFALAAGLSGAIPSTAIIVTAGLAEIAAGALAMDDVVAAGDWIALVAPSGRNPRSAPGHAVRPPA